jgi:capsule polysaccharide modification protein KpsS
LTFRYAFAVVARPSNGLTEEKMKVFVDGVPFRISFKHEAFFEQDGNPAWIHHRTTCTILDADMNVLAQGCASCCGLDNFDKAIGRKIALTRAISILQLEKEKRRQVWFQYHHRELGPFTNEEVASL